MGDAITELISTYSGSIAFLNGAATFLMGFFLNLELDNKLKEKMKKYYRILVMSLIIPAFIMNTHGVYLIISNYIHFNYLMALIPIYLPMIALLILIGKKIT